MNLPNIFAIASSVVVTVALSAAAQRAPVKVQLHDAQGQSVGTAELSPAPQGVMKGTIVAPGVTMGDDSHSVFSNGGTALVIHAKADDMKSDPAGNAGDRIVCGVIAKP